MKYTAEELFNWAMNNGYKDKIMDAVYYNNRGFIARPLHGELVKEGNQFYYVANVKDDFNVKEAIGNGSEEQNKILEKVQKYPQVMKTSIVAYKDKYRLRFAFDEDEKKGNDSLNKTIILDMINILGIDTTGKLKTIIDESLNVKANRQAMNIIGQGLKNKKEKE